MSLLDGLLSKLGPDVDVANLAAKVGIDPAMAAKAIAALGVAHQEPGDTIAGAADKTGLDAGILSQIVDHIGGEGSLGEFSRMLQDHPQAQSVFAMLDQDGDGNPLNDMLGMAKGLFGKS
ncbi:MAG: hypothetical protein JWQ16_2445 [Novosphingobium sp.]|nr:hypothetical protein [Novosphingobium sp.]